MNVKHFYKLIIFSNSVFLPTKRIVFYGSLKFFVFAMKVKGKIVCSKKNVRQLTSAFTLGTFANSRQRREAENPGFAH